MKIALIAMSGIRVCDQELLKLGLTLPGFVERSKVIAALPSLGLLTLAGMTPGEINVQYLEMADLKKMGELPLDFDLVAISTYSAQAMEAYELARYFKQRKIPVVMGGLHVSALPEEALQHCDSVVVGEGESSWLSCLKDFSRGRLQPMYDGRTQEFDLAQAPMPAFELLDISKYNRLTVQTSRGCPYQCNFCASSLLLTSAYKQKPAEKVLAEIDKIKTLWRRPFIEFADDNSFVNKAYWKRLLPDLKKRKVRWFAETDISCGEDEDLLDLMQESGCAEALIGLESPVSDGLNGLELKSNWKWKHLKYARESIRRIQGHGIRVNGCFMIGLDGHGPGIFNEVFDFATELKLFDVQITFPTPFPGTPFYAKLKAEGRLLEENAWNKCTLFDINFRPSDMEPEELRRGFMELGSKLYSEDFADWRKRSFEEMYVAYLETKKKEMPR